MNRRDAKITANRKGGTNRVNIVGAILTFIVVAVLGNIWSGYVLSVLWSWFMVTAFGLPRLSIPAAIGIAIVIGLLTHQTHTDKYGEEKKSQVDKLIEGAVHLSLIPLLALLTGWIVRFFL
jgi:hypothetical protein